MIHFQKQKSSSEKIQYSSIEYTGDGIYRLNGFVNIDVADPGLYAVRSSNQTGMAIKTEDGELYVSIYENNFYDEAIKRNKFMQELIDQKVPFKDIISLVDL